MNETLAQAILSQLLLADGQRMAILHAVTELSLPDCYVAAGFLRNLAWDQVHNFIDANGNGSCLNDVDIIYFDAVCRDSVTPLETAKTFEFALQDTLLLKFPNIDWDVKNQARMHFRNHHAPYANTSDAMTFWPEKETAVGVRLNQNKEFEFVAPFGLSRLFQCCISYNDKREKAVFQQRIAQKDWLQTWPKLKVSYD